MKAGKKYLYYDPFTGKTIVVKLVAILKALDAEKEEFIGEIKYWVQESDLTSGFFVSKEELKQLEG